jgi:hypothetical protein
MSGALPIAAIRCQLAAIVRVALDNGAMRLPIRAAFRDALQLLERDNLKLVALGQVYRPVDAKSGRRA